MLCTKFHFPTKRGNGKIIKLNISEVKINYLPCDNKNIWLILEQVGIALSQDNLQLLQSAV